MTKQQKFPTAEQLRKEESLRLHTALGFEAPGSDQYTKILSQITALDAHRRAIELKEAEQAHQFVVESLKAETAKDVEHAKAQTSYSVECQKATAGERQKQYDLAGKIVVTLLVVAFEHSGAAIISKAFGFIRD